VTTTDSSAARQDRLRRHWYDAGWFGSRTVVDAFREGARLHGETPVVFITDRTAVTTNVRQLHDAAQRAAAGLQGLGVRPGDVVAVQLTNRIECAVAYQAVLLCGGVLAPIVHVYGPHEVGFILAESQAKALVMPSRFRTTDYLGRIEAYLRINTLENVVVVDGDDDADYVSWNHIASANADLLPANPDSDDVCVLLYTSGTTSAPKGVQHSHNSLLAEQRTLPHVIASRSDDRQLVTFPPGHAAGVGSMLRPSLSGLRSVFLDGWDADHAADVIEQYAITSTAGAPFHLDALLGVAGKYRRISTLREFLVGAAGVSEELGRRAQAVGINSYRCYGLTEHPTVSAGRFDDPEISRLTTDGRPLPGSAVRIITSGGDDAPAGSQGEVVVRGPDQFIGYRDPALDADVFTADDWFRTGDLGYLDPDGRLVITDRMKDVIIRGGETISSAQVEDVLQAHPLVVEAAAVPVAHPRYGDVVGAVVVLQDGVTIDLADIRAHFAAAGLAKQKTPERLAFVEALPRTPLGKVRKADLRGIHFVGE
jgi:acyl-CoA synthetase (AMP-forming)/AMP-acid ligase II